MVKRSFLSGIAALPLVLVLVLPVEPATADRGYDQYRRLKVQARLYTSLTRHERAAKALLEAYDQYPDEAVLLEAVRLLGTAGKDEPALRLAERYLEVSRSPSGREDARRQIVKLRERLSRHSAELEVTTDPSGARVCLTDDLTECYDTPMLKWLEGKPQVLRFHYPGLAVRKHALPVEAGKHLKVEVTLSEHVPRGRLDVFAVNPQAVAHIDGNQLGRVPVLGFEVATGKHVVEVDNGNNQVWRGEVTIHSARTTTVYAGKRPPVKSVPGPILRKRLKSLDAPPPVRVSARIVKLPRVATVAIPKHNLAETNTPAPEPEPTADPEPGTPEPAQPDPELDLPIPIPVADPMPDPLPEPIADPDPTSDPLPEPIADPDPMPDPLPEPIADPDPMPDPLPEPIADPDPMPDPLPEPIADPDPMPDPLPEPIADPDPMPDPLPEPIADPDPMPDPLPDPIADANPEPDPLPDPIAVEPDPDPDPDPFTNPDPIRDPDPDPEPNPTPPGGGAGWMKITGWTTLGLGIAAGGAVIATGLLTLNNAQEANELDLHAPDYQTRFSDLQSKTETNALISNILYPVGGALLATGVVLLVLDAVSGPSTEGSVDLDAEGASFRIEPGFSPAGGVFIKTTVDF